MKIQEFLDKLNIKESLKNITHQLGLGLSLYQRMLMIMVGVAGFFARYHGLPHYSVMLTPFCSLPCGVQNVSPTHFSTPFESLQSKKKKEPSALFLYGRSGGIRTHDLLYPKQARYQTALHPEMILKSTEKIILQNLLIVNLFLK